VAVVSVAAVVVTQWTIAERARASLSSAIQLRLEEVRRLEPPGGVWRLLRENQPGGERESLPRIAERSAEWPTVQEAVRGIGRVQDAQLLGIVVGLGIAAAFSSLLALWLARTIARPVEAVGSAATRLAQGDLTSRVALPVAAIGVSAELEGLARDFNTMAASLERADAHRMTMIADVAHELRTPLTAMMLRLDAVRDGLAPLAMEEVERLRRQAGLLERLVEDLRTLSLADAGRLTLHLQEVDLLTIAHQVAEVVSPLARAKDVVVRIEPAAGVGDRLLVLGDRDRLVQVLGNLLDNAIRVSPHGGTVTIELDREHHRVAMSVRDQGPGLPVEQRPYVFERFNQGSGVRRDTRGSTGLGLAIVQSLVQLHQGNVTIDCPADEGAVFTVRLPVAAGATTHPERRAL
jgi:two-component system, OmpR family, sensor histidine kinase BaeS